MSSGLKSGSNPESTAWMDEVLSGEQPILPPTPETGDLVTIAKLAGEGIAEARQSVLGEQAVGSMAGEGPNPRIN